MLLILLTVPRFLPCFHSMTPPQPQSLAGKVLVVIGGTTGIGSSAVRAFLAAGAKVVAVGLDPESCKAAQETFKQNCVCLCADARDPQTAPQAVSRAVSEFGSFSGLYHVAGGSGRRWGDGPLHEITDEGWRATIDLNLTSVMYSNRTAVRRFLAQGSGGTILNTGSVLASSPSPRHFSTHAYSAAKAALEGWTRSCAAYYAPSNIRFNLIVPGLIATPMSSRAQQDAAVTGFVKHKQPLAGGGIGQPEHLDSAALYFMGDGSGFTTGQVLEVDGGWSVSEGIPRA